MCVFFSCSDSVWISQCTSKFVCILVDISEDLQRSLPCLVGRKPQSNLSGCWQALVTCDDLRWNMHSDFLRGVVLGHQPVLRHLGAGVRVLQPFHWVSRGKLHMLGGRRAWGGGTVDEHGSSKVTSIRRWNQWTLEGREATCGLDSLRSTGKDQLPHLRQPLIDLCLCTRTANNQLKLADFSTFVREPAALAQLSICREESREPGKKSF